MMCHAPTAGNASSKQQRNYFYNISAGSSSKYDLGWCLLVHSLILSANILSFLIVNSLKYALNTLFVTVLYIYRFAVATASEVGISSMHKLDVFGNQLYHNSSLGLQGASKLRLSLSSAVKTIGGRGTASDLIAYSTPKPPAGNALPLNAAAGIANLQWYFN